MVQQVQNNSNAVLYPAPVGAALSDDYRVKVNGKTVDVYRGVTWQPSYTSSFGGDFSFAYFDFSGEVSVEIISVKKDLNEVKILPYSKGVTPSVEGNEMTFTLTDAPAYLSIEPEGKHGPLLLFANPLEENIPAPGDPGVKYFAPGIHHVEKVELTDNETLYVAGGAILKGGIFAKGSNITIRGRGIVDGLEWPRFKGPIKNILSLTECDHVKVEGIILKDGWGWNFNMCGCRDVEVSNFKLMGSRCENNDGIDICNSRQVVIRDSFIRSDDDCIAPKGFGYRDNQAVEDIRVVRCSLWTDKAHVWRIGCECRAAAMRNMVFEDIDVLHYTENWVIPGDLPDTLEKKTSWEEIPDYMLDLPTCISLQPGEGMVMENIRFDNIRIHHEGQKWFLEIFPKVTQWAKNKILGPVRNCTFRNIQVYGKEQEYQGGIRICSPDPDYPVQGITFENVVRHGTALSENSPEIQVKGHVHEIKFI